MELKQGGISEKKKCDTRALSKGAAGTVSEAAKEEIQKREIKGVRELSGVVLGDIEKREKMEAGVLSEGEMRLLETSNVAFLPLYADESRYLVLKGGGGSGKSIFAGRKILERCARGGYHKFLVVRKVEKSLRESCYAQLRGQIAEHFDAGEFKCTETPMKIKHNATGNEIVFCGIDNPEKLKSYYNITGVWIEEATDLTEADFNQLDIRCRCDKSDYMQIILTFNPISILHWLKRRFFDRALPNCRVHESTFRDNRFLPQEAVAVLEGFRRTDPYYYSVYYENQWGVFGKSVFDAERVTKRLGEVGAPVQVGRFEYDLTMRIDEQGYLLSNVRFVEDRHGWVRIYAPPAAGEYYAIGADTAGEGSDDFIASVVDATTTMQVAVMDMETDEDIFAEQLYCLGRYYNDALVAVEVNFSTYPVRRLQQLSYPKQYVRQAVDRYTQRPMHAFGFRTDSKSRPLIIAGLVGHVRDYAETICDKKTLEQMLSFVRDERGRPQAQAGAKDDCVMAHAIALHACCQQQVRQGRGAGRVALSAAEVFGADGPRMSGFGAGEKRVVV